MMNKLYQKSEITFAILWILVYVVGTSFTDALSDTIGIAKSVTLIFYTLLSVIALIWMKKNNLYETYGLCKTDVKPSRFLYYIPLVIIASCNLWFGVTLNLSIYESIIYVFMMICVGFLEELIFRGFLFKAMCKDNVKSAIIVSSITFGIGHIVNLFNGSGMEFVSNMCQICNAVAFGFMFVIVFHRGKSLVPCIITHSVINALSTFANEANRTDEIQIVVSVILCVIAIAYTIVLLKTLPENK